MRTDHWPEPVRIMPHRQVGRVSVDRAWDLVGRQAELSELVSVLDQLDRGESGTRLVEGTGDAGIGKTALLNEIAKLARARGSVVLASRGTTGSRGTPVCAFADALDGHVAVLATAVSGPPPG